MHVWDDLDMFTEAHACKMYCAMSVLNMKSITTRSDRGQPQKCIAPQRDLSMVTTLHRAEQQHLSMVTTGSDNGQP